MHGTFTHFYIYLETLTSHFTNCTTVILSLLHKSAIYFTLPYGVYKVSILTLVKCHKPRSSAPQFPDYWGTCLYHTQAPGN